METSVQFEQLQRLAGGVVEAAGLELVQVEWKGGRLLHVCVDQPTGVGLTDCERVSRALSEALDAKEAAGEELVGGAYTLEVSSPGLDRPLLKRSDFERFAGQRAQVRSREEIAGRRSFTGIIALNRDAGVVVQPEGPRAEPVTIAWDNITQARLAPKWPEPKARRRK